MRNSNRLSDFLEERKEHNTYKKKHEIFFRNDAMMQKNYNYLKELLSNKSLDDNEYE